LEYKVLTVARDQKISHVDEDNPHDLVAWNISVSNSQSVKTASLPIFFSVYAVEKS
jgi:hypothetical protein